MTKWIWADDAVLPHSLAYFRKKFQVKAPGNYRFRISAESNYVAFCDGGEFLRGQYSDYPERKSFTEKELFLTPGEHLLAVEVYYCGSDFQSCWPSKTPGLWCELSGLVASDATWKAKLSPALLRDRIDAVDPQVGFSVGFDARQMENFTDVSFDDRDWKNAVVSDKNPEMFPRPVPVMRQNKIKAVCIEKGLLQRDIADGQSYAASMAQDTLRVERGNGFFLIFDLGCERTGIIELSCDAPAGIVIDFSHGEHLADKKVRCRIGERNFADRYITRNGKQKYQLFRRVGARYVELHILANENLVKDVSLDFIEETLPLPPAAKQICRDAGIMKMLDNSRRTLICCMHEHYEDCPWREQSLYAYDTRNQMLFGYYLFGNYDYAAYNWKLFADGLRPDGMLRLNAPSKVGPPIVSFAIAYCTAIYEHELFSGNRKMADFSLGAARRIAKFCMQNRDENTGLYLTPSGDGIWHFYEWRDGLDGGNGDGLDFSQLGGAPRMESIYNLYLIEMLENLAKSTRDETFQREADLQREAVRNVFYDKEKRLLRTRLDSDQFHATTQALGIVLGIVPENDVPQLLTRILNDEFISISLSALHYLVRALMRQGGDFVCRAEELVQKKYLPMTRGDATTMWETEDGEAAFENAGSLCHGWSALPVWFFSRYVLGIEPLSLGFADFAVDIARFSKLGDIEGEVVTPHGKIEVSYDADGKKLLLRHPAKTTPYLSERTRSNFAAIEIRSF